MKLGLTLAVFLLLVLWFGGARAQEDGDEFWLCVDPSTVTIDGAPAPPNSFVIFEYADRSDFFPVRTGEGSCWGWLVDVLPITVFVDGLRVDEGPFAGSAGERQYVTLSARRDTDPPPDWILFRGGVEDITIGGQPAPADVYVLAWLNGEQIGIPQRWGDGTWTIRLPTGVSGILLTVNGLPDDGGPYTASAAGVPYWISLSVPADASLPATDTPADTDTSSDTDTSTAIDTTPAVDEPTDVDAPVAIDSPPAADVPSPPARFWGRYAQDPSLDRIAMPPGIGIRAVRNAEVIGETVTDAAGVWSLQIPGGIGELYFEIDGRLDSGGPYAISAADAEIEIVLNAPWLPRGWDDWDTAYSALPPVDSLQRIRSKLHRFIGSGFGPGFVTAVDQEVSDPDKMARPYGGMRIVEGGWELSFAAEQAPRVAFEAHFGGRVWYSDLLTTEPGGVTSLTPADFTAHPLPHAFRGADMSSVVSRIDADGTTHGEAYPLNGVWLLSVRLGAETSSGVRLAARIDGELRWTREFALVEGGSTPVFRSDFDQAAPSPPPPEEDEGFSMEGVDVAPTVEFRIVARALADGRIEFGVRVAGSEEMLTPRLRFLPASPPLNRWLRSDLVALNEEVEGRIIARRDSRGRTEFGFRIDGRDDVFPQKRYLPVDAELNRWLRSSEISVVSLVDGG